MTDFSNKKNNEALIRLEGLTKHFPVRKGVFKQVSGWIQAVDDVNLNIQAGETLGLVGESGCGKTTVGRTILRLTEPTSGKIFYKSRDITSLNFKQMNDLRCEMQIIFQDPYASLDPKKNIGTSIMEGLNIHNIGDKNSRHKKMMDLLHKVGLQDYHANRFPQEFSGGQRQRIGIARALALEPSFIICDEPVSALDVSIQSQVLNLLKDLQDQFDLTYMFIAHNLSVVEHISDRIAVMYLGRIVELSPSDELFVNPCHPYTQALFSAIPIPDPNRKIDRIILSGDVPSPLNPPSGCRFHPRCPKVMDICREKEPQEKHITEEHSVSCWLYQ